MCADVTDGGVLAAVGRAQRRLRDEAGARPAGGQAPVHFTLRFLGDVPDEEGGGRIAAALASVRFEAFDVVVVGVGAFPSERRPRVVWVGADPEGGGRLAGLAAAVGDALDRLGPAAEDRGKGGGRGGGRGKPFKPHAAISRMGGAGSAAAATAAIRSLRSERFGTQRIGSFKLKKSVLSPGGAVHTDLSEVAAS